MVPISLSLFQLCLVVIQHTDDVYSTNIQRAPLSHHISRDKEECFCLSAYDVSLKRELTILGRVMPPEVAFLMEVPLPHQLLELLHPYRGCLRIPPWREKVILDKIGSERIDLP